MLCGIAMRRNFRLITSYALSDCPTRAFPIGHACGASGPWSTHNARRQHVPARPGQQRGCLRTRFRFGALAWTMIGDLVGMAARSRKVEARRSILGDQERTSTSDLRKRHESRLNSRTARTPWRVFRLAAMTSLAGFTILSSRCDDQIERLVGLSSR
jgi:hypothetical protein